MNNLKKFISYSSSFGFGFATKIYSDLVWNKLFNSGYSRHHQLILDYMSEEFADIVKHYQASNAPEKSVPNDAPIWFCWYQGENSMPEIVKACLRSVRRHAGEHPVMVLDYTNINEYVKFPQHIAERIEKGAFNLIYMSDFMRNYLLAEYGGIWLDTTIYALSPLELPQGPFWTVKRHCTNTRHVSKQHWTGFAMAGVKGNPLNSFVRDVLSAYHKKYPIMIDHFLIDYTIALGYKYVPCIKKMIDDVPLNNEELYYLQNHIYDDYDAGKLDEIRSSHFVQKIHHRYKGCNNNNSYFYHIISNNI